MKLIILVSAFLATVNASARVLVGKEFISMYPVAQQENVFEYQIINIGDTAAINVDFSDRGSFPTDKFEIVSGSLDAKYAVIPPHSSVSHHIVVVPRVPHAIEDKDVLVDYTDSESKISSRVSTLWFSKGRLTHFFHQDALKNIAGSKYAHFFVFAAIATPVTGLSALLYWVSKSRYTLPKRN